ncbi:MAG: YihY family inner membrane protein [Rhodospirillaceae bacterium]|nr:YihY family inner membrane protein [Rhodospirillaceae bacterium]
MERRVRPRPAPRVTMRFFLRRMSQHAILEMASSLSFSTIFALIPALALVLAAVAAYPGLSALRERMEQFLLSNLMPETGLHVGVAIAGFVRAAGELTAVGIIGLIAAALILLVSIESAFNKIFRVARDRRLAIRLLVFWTLMTIGPLLLGLGFSLFGIFAALPLFGAPEEATNFDIVLGSIAPSALGWLVLTVLYAIVPNRRVFLKDAMIGALLAAGLLTFVRYTFAFYVLTMTAYQAIYGAMAAIPVFLIWIFAVWVIVLAGAVVTASLPDWRHESSGAVVGPAGRLMTALSILERLERAVREGKGLTTARLARTVSAPDIIFAAVLGELHNMRFVVVTDTGEWMLARDLDRTPLADLVHGFGFGLSFGLGMVEAPEFDDSETGRRIAAALRQAAESEQRALSVTLGRLMQEPVEA